MKLIFNNLEEILDFLKDVGYTVTKETNCNCKDFVIEKEKVEIDKDDLKKKINDNEWWKNPYQPYYPSITPTYPYQPITTLEAQEDPELSKKFIMKNQTHTTTEDIQLHK